MNDLVKAMKDLEEQQVLNDVERMNKEGIEALEILQGLQEGMRLVGEEFEAGNYYLSELIMSGKIFEQALDIIEDRLTQSQGEAEFGTFLIGTVKEDIHDIGKNIAATILGCRGFNVVDLGVDVPIEKFIEAIKEHKPRIVGLSCLLTTCFENMKETIDAIESEGLRKNLPIIIGGATIDRQTSDYVGADAFCHDANEGVTIATKLIGGAS
jgi:methanogenic corrinoid protein MtbC1